MNSKGECTFIGKEPLTHGVYILVLNRTKRFEFLISADQDFILDTDMSQPMLSMYVGSDQDLYDAMSTLLFMFSTATERLLVKNPRRETGKISHAV